MAEPNEQPQTTGNDKAAWDKALSSGDFETLQNILTANFERQVENNHDIAREFVIPNIGTLTKEIDAYGLDATNPFFTFLKKYNQINGSTQVFWDPSKYNTLHNLLAKNVVNVTQLRDTCTKEQQMPILWNNSLWGNSPDDITWLVNTYAWFMNSGWGGLKISDAAINSFLDALGERSLTYSVRNTLRKLCFFTTAIKAFAGSADVNKSNIWNTVDNATQGGAFDQFISAYQKADNNGFPDVSSKLQSADVIEVQIKLLDELVRKNDRDATSGQYQRQQGADDKNATDTSSKIKAGEKIAQRAGVDFSKLKTQLGMDEYSALVDYAKSLSRR